MVVMLFGISNVGKTVTGKMLAEKLNYSFFDLDEEIKKNYKQRWKNSCRIIHSRMKGLK